ncbi:helix-turn-helix domain-containing protein [Anaeromassilibacillus sp. Marseille-P3371]|nr:helix-turn-helix domain-containing protein [Anaeromassilibacillus sp. Marseille-P3371]
MITAAVNGDPDAVARVVRHYSGYMAVLSMRTCFDSLGICRLHLDYNL